MNKKIIGTRTTTIPLWGNVQYAYYIMHLQIYIEIHIYWCTPTYATLAYIMHITYTRRRQYLYTMTCIFSTKPNIQENFPAKDHEVKSHKFVVMIIILVYLEMSDIFCVLLLVCLGKYCNLNVIQDSKMKYFVIGKQVSIRARSIA